MIDKTRILFYAAGVVAFSFSLPAVAFLFGMVAHENGHGLACLLFGLPYSWSLTQVVYETSPNPLINSVIKFAGGINQTLFSLVLFWWATLFEKRFLWKSIFDIKRLPRLSGLLGVEAALLIVAFHGTANAIWEGLFYQHYSQNYSNTTLTAVILLGSALVSFVAVIIRYKRLTEQKTT